MTREETRLFARATDIAERRIRHARRHQAREVRRHARELAGALARRVRSAVTDLAQRAAEQRPD